MRARRRVAALTHQSSQDWSARRDAADRTAIPKIGLRCGFVPAEVFEQHARSKSTSIACGDCSNRVRSRRGVLIAIVPGSNPHPLLRCHASYRTREVSALPAGHRWREAFRRLALRWLLPLCLWRPGGRCARPCSLAVINLITFRRQRAEVYYALELGYFKDAGLDVAHHADDEQRPRSSRHRRGGGDIGTPCWIGGRRAGQGIRCSSLRRPDSLMRRRRRRLS